jgi:hypothetical protein
MRLTVMDESDPDFFRPGDGVFSHTYLNGERCYRVLAADEEAGTVVVTKLNEKGCIYVIPDTHEIATEVLHGHVRIEPSLKLRRLRRIKWLKAQGRL